MMKLPDERARERRESVGERDRPIKSVRLEIELRGMIYFYSAVDFDVDVDFEFNFYLFLCFTFVFTLAHATSAANLSFPGVIDTAPCPPRQVSMINRQISWRECI